MHCSQKYFFRLFMEKAQIMHNANNSWSTSRARRTLGFSAFLVIQIFNSQEKEQKT